MPIRSSLVAQLVLALLCLSGARADEPQREVTRPNFNDHIKPILRQHCWKCHGDDKQKADLNLQNYASALRGGSGGPVLEAGRSSQSRLFQALTERDADARMPPKSPPLARAKIDLIRRWIDTGLRESAGSQSMVKARDLTFEPRTGVGTKPAGPPAMPLDLETIAVPERKRPFPVLAVDSSPWAPLVAVGALEHVRLIHAETRQGLGRLAFPEGEPHVVRFSRDGAVLLVGGGRPVESGKVVLFDVRSGKRLAEIGDEIDTVIAADLSPDQRLVALGGSGRVVKVYSTTAAELEYRLSKHTDWITAVAFSPDGTHLATADRAGGIHLWDAATGGILRNLEEHKAAVRALDWRADSKLLVSAGEDGKIIWWDASDGFPAITKTKAHPPPRPAGAYGTIPDGVLAAHFDRLGNLVTSGRDRVVRLWAPDGSAKTTFDVSSGIPITAAISHSGQVVLSGDSSGEVHFWELGAPSEVLKK